MHIDIKNNGGSFVDLHPHNSTMRTRLVGYKDDTSTIETVLLSDVIKAMHYIVLQYVTLVSLTAVLRFCGCISSYITSF